MTIIEDVQKDSKELRQQVREQKAELDELHEKHRDLNDRFANLIKSNEKALNSIQARNE